MLGRLKPMPRHGKLHPADRHRVSSRFSRAPTSPATLLAHRLMRIYPPGREAYRVQPTGSKGGSRSDCFLTRRVDGAV